MHKALGLIPAPKKKRQKKKKKRKCSIYIQFFSAFIKKEISSQAPVSHGYNTSYLGD
jgi:hypothetical protein